MCTHSLLALYQCVNDNNVIELVKPHLCGWRNSEREQEAVPEECQTVIYCFSSSVALMHMYVNMYACLPLRLAVC